MHADESVISSLSARALGEFQDTDISAIVKNRKLIDRQLNELRVPARLKQYRRASKRRRVRRSISYRGLFSSPFFRVSGAVAALSSQYIEFQGQRFATCLCSGVIWVISKLRRQLTRHTRTDKHTGLGIVIRTGSMQ